MTNSKGFVILLVIAIGLLATPPANAAERVKVGILVPFTGKYSGGAKIVDSILFKHLKDAGVLSVSYDTGSEVGRAVQLTKRLIELKMSLIVTTAHTTAVVGAAAKSGIPVLSTSTLLPASYHALRSEFPDTSAFLFKPPAQKEIDFLTNSLAKLAEDKKKPALLVELKRLTGISSAARAFRKTNRRFQLFEPQDVARSMRQSRKWTEQFGFAMAVGRSERDGNQFIDRLVSDQVHLPTLWYARPDRRVTTEIVAHLVVSAVEREAKTPEQFAKFLTKSADEGAFDLDWSVMAYALPKKLMEQAVYKGKKTCICNSEDGKVCKKKECREHAKCKKIVKKTTCSVSCG